MKTIHYFIIVISTIVCVCICCTYSDKQNCSMNDSPKTISQLKQEILETGDTSAYYDLTIQLMEYKFGDDELLPYALIMANKYNYTQAYFDVFDCLTAKYSSDIGQIDSLTAQLAIKYLLIASEKGHWQASEIVESHSITKACDNNIGQLNKIFQ